MPIPFDERDAPELYKLLQGCQHGGVDDACTRRVRYAIADLEALKERWKREFVAAACSKPPHPLPHSLPVGTKLLFLDCCAIDEPTLVCRGGEMVYAAKWGPAESQAGFWSPSEIDWVSVRQFGWVA